MLMSRSGLVVYFSYGMSHSALNENFGGSNGDRRYARVASDEDTQISDGIGSSTQF